jgi:hypothetical protein
VKVRVRVRGSKSESEGKSVGEGKCEYVKSMGVWLCRRGKVG